jgi:hypothetical protein
MEFRGGGGWSGIPVRPPSVYNPGQDDFTHFPNFRSKTLTIAVMNLKPGMNILPSSCYTHYKSWTTPIPVWAGQVSTSIVFENRHFMPLTYLWSRRPKLLINQLRQKPRALETLEQKKGKKSRFTRSGPLSHILSQFARYFRSWYTWY